MKYTRGPWSVGMETNEDDGIGQVISPDGWHIAKVEMYPILENTRLIAASPDLYAACKEALRYFDNRPGNWEVGLADMLRKATHKAEGGK